MKFIFKLMCILLIGYTRFSYGMQCTSSNFTSNSSMKQIYLDNTHNGYWLITNDRLYFLDNTDQIKLVVAYDHGDGSGVAVMDNNTLLISTTPGMLGANIYAYNLNAVYTQGVIYTAQNKLLDISSLCPTCNPILLPKSGNVLGVDKIYTDNNNYLYALYNGDGRQIYTWSYNSNSNQWTPKGWLNGSTNAVYDGVSVNAIFDNNALHYVNFTSSGSNNLWTVCSQSSCQVAGSTKFPPMLRPLSFIYHSVVCNVDGSGAMESYPNYPLKAFCADNSQFEIDSTDNKKFADGVSDITYNPSNDKTYILSGNSLYRCQ